MSKRIPAALWFLLPGMLGFVAMYIAPFFLSLCYAFLDSPVNGAFVGFRNFAELLTNKAYLKGFGNTLRFIAISVPLNMGLALAVAMMLHRLKRYKELFSLMFLIPLVIPSGSMVMFWNTLFSKGGALNALLTGLGLGQLKWLDSSLAVLIMVLVFVWKNMGYNMILFLAGLSSIPKEHYEAAWVDGVMPWQSFRYITFPGLAPTFVLVTIMSIVNSFKVFKEIYLITGSYPHESIYTLQHFMNNMFGSLNYQKLSTATALLVLVIALFTQGLLRLERRFSL